MKVYKLLFYDPDMEWYFFATKREAEEFSRKRRKEILDEGIPPDNVVFDIDAWEAADSREGVCDLLNRLVTAACINEG